VIKKTLPLVNVVSDGLTIKRLLLIAGVVAIIGGVFLLVVSLAEFSHSGPEIQAVVLERFSLYMAYSVARLVLWAALIIFVLSILGGLFYWALAIIFQRSFSIPMALGFSLLFPFILVLVQFSKILLYFPGLIVASFSFRISRLYPFWDLLTPMRVDTIVVVFWAVFILVMLFAAFIAVRKLHNNAAAAVFFMVPALLWAFNFYLDNEGGVVDTRKAWQSNDKPNIIMIGSDSLRADKLFVNGYEKEISPAITRLAEKGTNFTNAYVTLARTTPSVSSIFTGKWPHNINVRSNYIADDGVKFPAMPFPEVLKRNGYNTAAVGDWAASDFSKFDFGFDYLDVAPDQWNLKYLLRQGPKPIRLFLSLFFFNDFGKKMLPEIYYIAGAPLTNKTASVANEMVERLALMGQPFFINIFIASTHAPFSSEFPYYIKYSDPKYRGESKFAMSGLSKAENIVKLQQKDKRYFDVQQIHDLYDGGVKAFDTAIEDIVSSLEVMGVDKNTIIVIYSDHGMDLFEGESWGQGNMLSDYSYRIPLVIFNPHQKGAGKVDGIVRSVDIAPTLLELAGVSDASLVGMDGVSLVDAMRGKSLPQLPAFLESGLWLGRKVKGLPDDRISYPEIFEILEIVNDDSGTLSIKPEYYDRIIEAKARMIKYGDWEMLYFPNQEGATFTLYNRRLDPAGGDLSKLYPDKFVDIKSQLLAWIKGDSRLNWCNEHLVPVDC